MKHTIKSSLTALFVLATLPAQAEIISIMDSNGQIRYVDTNQTANSNGRIGGVSGTMATVNQTQGNQVRAPYMADSTINFSINTPPLTGDTAPTTPTPPTHNVS